MADPRPEPSDSELFAAYAAGDREAFRRLFDRYGPLLTRVIARRVQGAEIVDDLVQQTFLQVHRARHDFRRDGNLRSWLIAIGLNVMRQHFRRTKRREEVPLADVGEHAPSVPAHDPVAAERRRQLHAALAKLPDKQRTAIELHWLEGLSFPEVAEAVGAKVSAVKVRAHRGYAKLRELLEAAGVTDPTAGAP